jgi:hypothetical protein
MAGRTRVMRRRLIREASLDALFPCSTHGYSYREERDGESVPIGCRDALKLGQTEFRQFEEIVELACDFYRVYRSLQQPGRFLVVPLAYCVTRYASDIAAKAYRPVLYLYSVLDGEVAANNRILLHASLQPDIPVHEMRDLQRRLSPLASSPHVVLPTQIQATLESLIALDDSLSSQPQVVQFPDSLQVTIPTDVAGARILRACLEHEGIVGSATWLLPDGSSVASALRMRLDSIVGPWQQSVVEMEPTDTGALLTNRSAQSVEVSEVRLYGDADPVHVPVGAELAPGTGISVEFDRSQGEPVVVASPVDSAATLLTEIRSFIEEITVSVAFVDLIDHASRGLERLEIAARLRGLEPIHHVDWNQDIGSVDIPLPITTEIDAPVLEYRVTKVMANGDRNVTPWLAWELAQGSVISLTWSGIQ